ncbi:YfmQ family protein [Metabacillus iocasae]|uniref:YfmQ n=1 Tax=Priestia iocasae TaxID=2291674 RepID=A0ABS2QYH4_9BACI|nr:YfmQ family protein [Metabacillus iocasae]MBM7703519.1 hypothetical protein [Metabacillus iocasae]
MTLTVLLSLIVLAFVKILLTCLPNDAVAWMFKKFETHSKLDEENTTVTIDSNLLEGKGKIEVLDAFNEAIFIKQHYIFPGNEHLYLQPDNGGTPIVIDTKMGKRDVRLFVYSYHDYIDVVKQGKKKLVAYRLVSNRLQQHSVAVAGEVV